MSILLEPANTQMYNHDLSAGNCTLSTIINEITSPQLYILNTLWK